MVPISAQLLAQLRDKQPARSHSIPDELPGDFAPVDVSMEESLRRAPNYGAPGRSGRRPEHGRALTARFADPVASRVMSEYDGFASAAASARFPRWFYLVWATSWIAPLAKRPAEGAVVPAVPDARPVAIGEADLRAVLSSLIRSRRDEIERDVAPQQLGCGVQAGISILVHGMRHVLTIHPSFVIVKLDLKNAFNIISRAVMLRRVVQSRALGFLAPFLHLLDGPEALLLVGSLLDDLFADHTAYGMGADDSRRGGSAEGGRQGAPSVPPSFCIGIQPELRALDEELRVVGGLARAILDDIYAVGPACVVFPAVERCVQRLLEATDSRSQPGKFACWSPWYPLETCEARRRLGAQVGRRVAPVEPQGAALEGFGIVVGGIPLGDEVYVRQGLHADTLRIESYFSTIEEQLHADDHAAWAMQQFCLQPCFDFHLQHVPPSLTRAYASRIDEALDDLTSRRCSSHPDEWPELARRRLSQPVRRHGCGIRRRLDLAPSAYACSLVRAAAAFLPSAGVAGGEAEARAGFFPVLGSVFGSGGAFWAGGSASLTTWTAIMARVSWRGSSLTHGPGCAGM